MSFTAFVVLLVEVTSAVTGQVLLKHAMDNSRHHGFRKPKVLALLTASIVALAISFFLMLALLQHFDLSFFFPFQASTTIFIVAAAAIFLRERLSLQIVLGTLLIAAGIALVSAS